MILKIKGLANLILKTKDLETLILKTKGLAASEPTLAKKTASGTKASPDGQMPETAGCNGARWERLSRSFFFKKQNLILKTKGLANLILKTQGLAELILKIKELAGMWATSDPCSPPFFATPCCGAHEAFRYASFNLLKEGWLYRPASCRG